MIQRRTNPRRNVIRIIIVLTILIPLVYVCLLFWQPLWLFHRRDLHDGNLIVKHVESFRVARGRLPNSLEELGTQGLSDQVFYQKIDDNTYEVWFSIALGESEIYDSSTKVWR